MSDVLMPVESAPVDATVPPPICSCGAVERHATNAHMCANGHFVPGNSARRIHGIRSFEQRGATALDTDQQAARRSFIDEVIRDRGGEAELSAVERARIKRLGELDVVASLIANDLARRGLFTVKGRIRSSIDKWLSVLATFDRYADRVGAERRPKSVQSLAEYLNGRTPGTGSEDV